MFKIKDGYKLESQMPETMKLFDSQNKNKEKVPSFAVAGAISV